MGLNVHDYHDEENMEEETKKIFNNDFLTKDDFIYMDWSAVGCQITKKDEQENKPKDCYSMVDLWIVIIHTFVFMLNYYALSPTAYDYVEALGYSKSLTAVISSLTPITETCLSFMYNALTKKSYKVCYYISLTCLTLANLSYASADSANSLLL